MQKRVETNNIMIPQIVIDLVDRLDKSPSNNEVWNVKNRLIDIQKYINEALERNKKLNRSI